MPQGMLSVKTSPLEVEVEIGILREHEAQLETDRRLEVIDGVAVVNVVDGEGFASERLDEHLHATAQSKCSWEHSAVREIRCWTDGAVDEGRWPLCQDGDLSLQLGVLLGHDIHLVPHADHFLIERGHFSRDRVLAVCQGRLDHFSSMTSLSA